MAIVNWAVFANFCYLRRSVLRALFAVDRRNDHLVAVMECFMPVYRKCFSWAQIVVMAGMQLFHHELLGKETVAICSMFRNEARFLDEWITYHKLIGVSRFYLFNDRSDDGYLEILQPYIDSGLVILKPSCRRLAEESHIHVQVWELGAVLREHAEDTDWVAHIDLDEYIVLGRDRDLPTALERFKEASAVFCTWRCFGTSNVIIPPGGRLLTSLVKSSLAGHPNNSSGKSIYRPKSVNIGRLWSPHSCGLLGGDYYYGDGTKCSTLGESVLINQVGFVDKFISVNHYMHKDEVGFARRMNGYYDGGMSVLLQHYEEFNLVDNLKIVNFLKRNYPEVYASYWDNAELPRAVPYNTPKSL